MERFVDFHLPVKILIGYHVPSPHTPRQSEVMMQQLHHASGYVTWDLNQELPQIKVRYINTRQTQMCVWGIGG